MNAENARLQETAEQKAAWKKWGPYLSERQWGTVREDYTMATLSKSNVLQDLGR